MRVISVQRAKSFLSRLVDALELGRERGFLIARNGRPAAKLVPIDAVSGGQRIGVARGKFEVPDAIDAQDEEVAQLFLGAEQP